MFQYSIESVQRFIAPSYRGRQIGLLPYAYSLTFTSFAQNATASQQLSIQASADFLLLGVKYRAQIGTAQTISNKTAAFVRMLITDNGSGEQFTASAVDLENYCANGRTEAGVLPYPRLIAGRSSLTVALTGYQPTAETYTTIDLLFEGVNIRVFK